MKRWLEGKALLWVAVGLLAVTAVLAAAAGTDASGMTAEERRIASVLSAIHGAGKVEAALFYAASGGLSQAETPVGAVIVAQGAGDMAVRLNLIRAVRTLLSLPEAAVDVFIMEEGR